MSILRGYGNRRRVGFRQRVVSGVAHSADVPDDVTALLNRLIGDHPDAPAEILQRAAGSTATPLLVAAGLLSGDLDLVDRAARHATTTRDRQLVALAETHLRGDAELLDVLVRDHLSEYPDNLLAAWIAGRAPSTPGTTTEQEHAMSDLRTAAPISIDTARGWWWRRVGRWLVSFAGFPIGGYAAFLLLGRVDGPAPALVGGLVTGAVLGAAQAWALGVSRPRSLTWIVATAVGLMAGVAAGASVVDYRTDLGSLAVQGAVSGVLVGVAQAVLLVPRVGRLALAWPAYLGATYALGWVVTTSAGIDVDQQFTIFGSSGALIATFVTAVLPIALNRRHDTV